MSSLDLDAIKRDYDKARETISDLRHQRKRWIMSIPARPDDDPDLIIGAAIRHGGKLIAEVERLRQELANAKKIGAAEELERKIAQIRADLNDMNPDAYKRRGKVEPGYCEALNDIAQGLECRAAELRAEVGG